MMNLITMGDAAGIGSEILIKAWAQEPQAVQTSCVAGDWLVMQRAHAVCQQTGLPVPTLRLVDSLEQASQAAQAGLLPVLQACQPSAQLPDFGQTSAEAGRMAAECIVYATNAVLRKQAKAVVTAPIHKEGLAAAGVKYPGHTEMLQALAAEYLQVPVQKLPVRMMLANPELKTVLNSIHVSLQTAINQVTQFNLLQTLQITDAFLQRIVPNRQPIIAVAGLNPHAGEGGLFGTEEIESIMPAIAQARQQGIQAIGPFPPDTVFMRARAHAKDDIPFCDAVIAMYHDQGLIPVKYLGVEQGVNVTLGLPLIRTSPDHGTAMDVAGTGHADPASLLAAIHMAGLLVS